jgi:hypothetical protein
MKAEFSYRYTVLRYEHDVRTEEFLNVGVLFWVPEKCWLEFLFTDKTSRLTAAFPGAQADELIRSLKELRSKLAGLSLSQTNNDDVLDIAHRALPADDSSLKWSTPRAGYAANPKAALELAFNRMVMQYEHKRGKNVRSDQDLWNDLAQHLRPHSVLGHFHRAAIQTPIRKYRFDHAWQNGCPHIVEPVSLDGETKEFVADKATRLVGQMMDLARSEEDFMLHVVLGKPLATNLQAEYASATELLDRGADKSRMQLIRQEEVPSFANRVANEIKTHFGATEDKNRW